MDNPGTNRLLDQDELRERIRSETLPEWTVRRYETYRETMLRGSTPYPCYFAVESEEEATARYVFCESAGEGAPVAGLAEPLASYARTYDEINGRSTCVVFFESPGPDNSEAVYVERFWETLQTLHEHDPGRWPADRPTDPDDPGWGYWFADERLFVVGRAPFYERRRSRYTPEGLEITFQPGPIFADIGPDTEKGQLAHEVIMDRLKAYDDVRPHETLVEYGTANQPEWRKYLPPDTNEERRTECPLSITRE